MKRMVRVVIVLAGVAFVAWASKEVFQEQARSGQEQARSGQRQERSGQARSGQRAFTRLDGVQLREHRHNDGDSFHVIHQGRDYEFRLYFVDTPESRYKTYRGGRNNGKRLDDQARYFGLSRDQVVKVGAHASTVTAAILSRGPFTIFTHFEPVFDSERFYAFVKPAKQNQWLFQTLIDQGLARIHTKGTKTPNGVSWQDTRRELKNREERAKQKKVGGWQ